ncbi:SDR family NAD(P)-dependent oxidoreductase [Deinococcus humi]|uniref:NAD(P)-dependent dehydrogenase (Short-subunit alcohol dehydrogenase family) n=1 Tax=Deinococcus humi TaxID=662880 RepID=A0A7W8JUK9_9DEIO|nr:SDR family NAD(P)-dependent oxidoreductase [Deinococcus humi]MBB5363454.1 NAD(P)-dependent dehydrogenase (short-subunit alcohol dehydrogenase family) [Deinococcus humi]GGO26416.1 oxidoreductase [Deinococcus humi]
MTSLLRGKVALVTGASRGIGRGIALGLGEAGATVYVTGRTLSGRSRHMPFLAGSLEDTAQQVTELGGEGIAVQCDHTDDAQTRTVIERIREERGQLDVLVNNVWGGYEGLHIWDERGEKWDAPFWEQPTSIWDDMFAAGVRAHYVTSQLAAPLLIGARGLVVSISFFAAEGHKDTESIPYFLAKNATDRMALAMANHLRPHGVTSVSLYPGLVRTEGIMLAPEGAFDLSNSESPQFIGRAVAALASDANVFTRTGQVVVAAELALEYGFSDIDGKQPRSLRADSLG